MKKDINIGIFVLTLLVFGLTALSFAKEAPKNKTKYNTISIPQVDWNGRADLQVITDKRDGVYLGHVNTVLLDDEQTILAVYPLGHAAGAIQYKQSPDGGRTWNKCLPTPESWKKNDEVPTMFRTVDAQGKKRILVFKSGSFPIQMSISEDEGKTWSEFAPIGPYGGFVAMSSMIPLQTGKGHYMAFYVDRDRKNDAAHTPYFSEYRTIFSITTRDGGVTWDKPKVVLRRKDIQPSEPCGIRSPDNKQIAILLRENSRTNNSQVVFSNDEGKTWTDPVPLPNALTGDRHVARYLKDGRLMVVFRQMSLPINGTPFSGDWVVWVGTYDDLAHQTEGQFVIRLKDNQGGDFQFPPTGVKAYHVDCAYAGLVILKDGTAVATTYGHWEKGVKPYILTVRIPVAELNKIKKP